MKMRFPLFAIAAASVFAASCTADKDLYDENYQKEVQEATYDQQFEKLFGKIDPNQDWSMAENFSINVTTSTTTDIKVFAPSQSGVFSLVADYSNVNGSKTVDFVAPEGTETVYVADAEGNMQAVSPKNGSVSFKSTRAAVQPTESLLAVSDIDGVQVPNSLNGNGDITLTKEYFSLVSKTAKFPIGYLRGSGSNGNFAFPAQEGYGFGIYYWDDKGVRHDDFIWDNSKPGANHEDGVIVDFSKYGMDGVRWGLFIQQGNVRTYDYDEYNPKHGKAHKYAIIENHSQGEGYVVIAFELHDKQNPNYQDLMFYIPAKYTDVVEKDEFAWALACEDLGTTDDFDFNDIVFSVSYTSGKDKMYVTPLAAGGVLKANVTYKGQNLFEIHEQLRGAQEYTMTNTTTIDKKGTVYEIPIVDSNFNLTSALYDFGVIVDPDNEGRRIALEKEIPATAPQVICVPSSWRWPLERKSINEAYPQGRTVVVGDKKLPIPGFADWVQGNDKPQSWYIYPVDEKVIIRK